MPVSMRGVDGMGRLALLCLSFLMSMQGAAWGFSPDVRDSGDAAAPCLCGEEFGASLSYLGTLVFTAPGRPPVGKITQIEIVPDLRGKESEAEWAFETYIIRVTTTEGRTVDHPITAAYGDFLVAVPEKLFGKKRDYIVLLRAIGKGTGVNTRVLEVWQLREGKLHLVYQRTVADYVRIFPTEQWAYCVKIAIIPNADPVKSDAGIDLVLRQDPFGRSFYPRDRNGELLPKYLCIALDAGAIKEFPGETCYTAFWKRNNPSEKNAQPK
ncbi:MAG: hypothetical protein KatS3mg119_1316 [Rhodothalassiaceae bacterium]|nr:MAG: hypothetical protein KatS3mg119_1316 [Rhodothalassiaceae bacterium]